MIAGLSRSAATGPPELAPHQAATGQEGLNHLLPVSRDPSRVASGGDGATRQSSHGRAKLQRLRCLRPLHRALGCSLRSGLFWKKSFGSDASTTDDFIAAPPQLIPRPGFRCCGFVMASGRSDLWATPSRNDRSWRVPARRRTELERYAATIFTDNGAPQALVASQGGNRGEEGALLGRARPMGI